MTNSPEHSHAPPAGVANPDVAAMYARLALQSVDSPPDGLMAGSGLTQRMLQESEFIPWQALAAIFDNLDAQAGTAAWPVEFGARLNITCHGTLGFAALSAPTVGDAITTLGTYHRARISAVAMTVREVDHHLQFAVHDVTRNPVFTKRVALIALKVVESLLLEILGELPDDSVSVSLATPEDEGSPLLRGMFQPSVRFNADAHNIAVPMAWRNLPSPLHEETAYRDNILECQHAIERDRLFATMADMVGYALRSHLARSIAGHEVPIRPPALTSIAEQASVTPRTLTRRLKAEGTSYQHILDELRREYAVWMLADESFSIAGIATRLGYTEPPNFRRAFRRWYGVSPMVWRQAPGAQEPSQSGRPAR